MLFYICRFVAESVLHLSLIPKKLFGSARIPCPNMAGVGWARARPPVATLLGIRQGPNLKLQYFELS